MRGGPSILAIGSANNEAMCLRVVLEQLLGNPIDLQSKLACRSNDNDSSAYQTASVTTGGDTEATIARHELDFVQQFDRWQQESKSFAASRTSCSKHILQERRHQQSMTHSAETPVPALPEAAGWFLPGRGGRLGQLRRRKQ